MATHPTTPLGAGAAEPIELGPHLTPEQFDHLDDPVVVLHLTRCRLCRRLADVDRATPLPTSELVTESAFRWPGEPMARGGMAVVFQGHDRRLERTVILKVPRDDEELPASMNEMFQRRLETEARVLAKLQHPGIVTIYEVGRSTTGAPFCVLERVEGVPLRDRLDELAAAEREGGGPRTGERLELVASLVGIVEAMAYAHDRGVVHRDLNPNNILLGKRGEATLIDWGIAKDIGAYAPSAAAESLRMSRLGASSSGRAQTISAGTPPYVCYEQTQGYAAEPSFDVYSFGVTLYEVVAGAPPYVYTPSGSPDERQAALRSFLDWAERGPVPPPAAPRDPELSGIIARAIDRDARRRFSADELLRALKQYLTGELVFSHRYSLSGRAGRWVRKRRGLTIALALAVVGVVASVVIWLGMRAQEAQHAHERAELESMAAAAQADAATKRADAKAAASEAAAALARADEAERAGQDAKALRQQAEAKRREAEAMARSAEDAASKASGEAATAMTRWQQAQAAAATSEAARVAAETARAEAEAARQAAVAARTTAEAARDTAVAARTRAEEERARAEAARVAAIADRDAAQAEREAAIRRQEEAIAARDQAVRAREAAEAGELAAKARVAALEARVRELEAGAAPPPPPPPPPSGDDPAADP
ncbi:MAG: serine/threonine-protein kinase [Kofleriaceae bacterium]